MNLIVDNGNSATKITIISNYQIIETQKYFSELQLIDYLVSISNQYIQFHACIISSVGFLSEKAISSLQSLAKKTIILTHQTPIPVENTYQSKETLGKDRIAAVVGASYLYPNRNCLIIDAGTAITYDVLTADQIYLGGNISPGIDLRFKSLNHFTKNLPLVSKQITSEIIGKTTIEAIKIGVQQGIINEINGYIELFSQFYPDLIIIFTGGDTFFFDKCLKKTIFAEPFLVQIGLNRILEYNDKI